MARLMQSIPVARAADNAKPGTGKVYYPSPSNVDEGRDEKPNFTILKGIGTNFRQEFSPKKQIQLPKSTGFATAEIVEVIDDETLKLKKEFGSESRKQLVDRGSKGDGMTFKVLPFIDQSDMYKSVFTKLKEGGSVGIFPEGGSHDQTDLLPLKAGLAIMALGAMAENPGLSVRIVPVGLSYFHPHRFRSRAVVEFGSPITLPKETVESYQKGGKEKREAIGQVMDLVYDGLKSVTVRAPDFDTLMVIQAVRRLYRPPGQTLTLSQVVELNRRFIAGYIKNKDEPKVVELKTKVTEYNTLLRRMGLKDHQVELANRPAWKSLILLVHRLSLLSVWGVLALPGALLNAPMFLAAGYISHRKAKEALAASTVKVKGRDVLATWKLLVSLGMAPVLYLVYAGISTWLAFKYDLPRRYKVWMPIWTLVWLPTVAYSALKFGEVGMDVYKSIKPLFISLIPGNHRVIEHLRVMRASLASEISDVVEEFGPKTFDDWDQRRVIPPSTSDRPGVPRRKSTYGPEAGGLNHPMAWLDEALFGFSRAPRRNKSGLLDQSQSGYASEETEYSVGLGRSDDETGDYEAAVGHAQSASEDGAASPEGVRRRRRSSASRKGRSGLDLTKLG